jgi:DNA polymerase-3 subunit beta
MKIACLQENLSKGLAIVSRAVASRSTTLPVLSNILLSTDNGRLKLSATNLEIGINCWIGCKIELDGDITVPARTFADLVNTLPHERIDMELIERTQTLHLRCGRSEANIKGIDAQEFPFIPSPEGDEQILIEPDVLGKMIQQVAFAAATDESRLMLTGVLMTINGNEMTMAAADGFRVSRTTGSLNDDAEQREVLIPAKALTELARISGDQEDPVEVTFTPSRNQILFHLTNADLVAQLLDMQFPDYEQIIPAMHTTRAVVNTADLQRAVRAVNIFARDGAFMVKLSVEKSGIRLSGKSDETGDGESGIDASVEGEPLIITLNARYLLDALKVMRLQTVLKLVSAAQPMTLHSVGDDGFIHVIMPIQVGRK